MNKNTKILIVGLGLIGGSYASGLTDKGYFVGAIDINSESINYALGKGIIKEGISEINGEFISKYDVIIFALYPHLVIDWIKENQKYIKENTILTDVTGVKTWIINEVEKIIRPDLEFIGCHPMAGREVYGVQNSDKNIFKGANYLITPTDKTSEKALNIAKKIGEELEFKNISCLSKEKHDEMIGFLSQLTHCIAISLMNCKESSDLIDYTGDSFRDLTRIAKINENMWTELFLINKEELLSQMDLYLEHFNILRNALINNDSNKMKEIMKLSTERRKLFDRG